MSNTVKPEATVESLKLEVAKLKRELMVLQTKNMDQAIRIGELKKALKQESFMSREIEKIHQAELSDVATRVTVRAIPTPRDAWKPAPVAKVELVSE